MCFQTVDELFNFYQEHARLKGFSVVKRSVNKIGHEYVRYVMFTCDKVGKRGDSKICKRNNCLARANAMLKDGGKFHITKVEHDHSHQLFPDMFRLMSAYRNVSNQLK